MNYSHFISYVNKGDLLTDGVNTYAVIVPEFYSCGTSRIIVENSETGERIELAEFDSRCANFIHGPIPGEFDS